MTKAQTQRVVDALAARYAASLTKEQLAEILAVMTLNAIQEKGRKARASRFLRVD